MDVKDQPDAEGVSDSELKNHENSMEKDVGSFSELENDDEMSNQQNVPQDSQGCAPGDIKQNACGAKKGVPQGSKHFRTPLVITKLIGRYYSEGINTISPRERSKWLDLHGCKWNTFRRWLKDYEK